MTALDILAAVLLIASFAASWKALLFADVTKAKALWTLLAAVTFLAGLCAGIAAGWGE
jgi:hypothetical protein